MKEACLSQQGDYADFRISLAGGLAYSSKRILYDLEEDNFSIVSEIDDSYQDDLSEAELITETIIVKAIENRVLFQAIF